MIMTKVVIAIHPVVTTSVVFAGKTTEVVTTNLDQPVRTISMRIQRNLCIGADYLRTLITL